MAFHRKIPWFPLLLVGTWLAMTSLAIRDMNSFAIAVAPLAAHAHPARTAPAPAAVHIAAATAGFSEEIQVFAPPCAKPAMKVRGGAVEAAPARSSTEPSTVAVIPQTD